jgi:hypothetical protein
MLSAIISSVPTVNSPRAAKPTAGLPRPLRLQRVPRNHGQDDRQDDLLYIMSYRCDAVMLEFSHSPKMQC